MDLHQNARSYRASRGVLVRRVVEEGWWVEETAAAMGISERSAYRWLARYRAEGVAGSVDSSSRPGRVPRRTGQERIEQLVALRREGCSGAEIAELLGMPRSTVGRWLRRRG